MKWIISVNAEGGPLLLVDARAVRSWRGADEESKDYENLCATFNVKPTLEGYETVIDGQKAVAWEMVAAVPRTFSGSTVANLEWCGRGLSTIRPRRWSGWLAPTRKIPWRLATFKFQAASWLCSGLRSLASQSPRSYQVIMHR